MKKSFLFIALILLIFPVLSVAGEGRTYTVAGLSMSPTLMPGDRVAVSDEREGPLRRGNLVAIGFKGRSNPVVKRAVAVAGDRVEVTGDRLSVNGKELRTINTFRWRSTLRQLERYNWTVPVNTLFVLGDNPEKSRDSRRLGLISVDQVVGRVISIAKSGGSVVSPVGNQ